MNSRIHEYSESGAFSARTSLRAAKSEILTADCSAGVGCERAIIKLHCRPSNIQSPWKCCRPVGLLSESRLKFEENCFHFASNCHAHRFYVSQSTTPKKGSPHAGFTDAARA